MTLTLHLGTRTYSSWSLRAGLIARVFDLPLTIEWEDLSKGPPLELMGGRPVARTVPTLVTEGGAVVADSLAIAEELASLFPDAGLWPSDPTRRATARFVTAEMHASFAALRGECPMNMRVQYQGFELSEAGRGDLARIEALWAYARSHAADTGPWLLGDYSIADAFYAPIVARIVGHDLAIGPEAKAYVNTHLSHAPFQTWRAEGMAVDPIFDRYAKDLPTQDWPDQLS